MTGCAAICNCRFACSAARVSGRKRLSEPDASRATPIAIRTSKGKNERQRFIGEKKGPVARPLLSNPRTQGYPLRLNLETVGEYAVGRERDHLAVMVAAARG